MIKKYLPLILTLVIASVIATTILLTNNAYDSDTTIKADNEIVETIINDQQVEDEPTSDTTFFVDTYTPLYGEILVGDKKTEGIRIIGYSSLTCPHCANFHLNKFPELKEKLIDTGKAIYIYRHLPTDGISLVASTIVSCLEDQSHDILNIIYKNQNKLWEANSDNPAGTVYEILESEGIKPTLEERQCGADQEVAMGMMKDLNIALQQYELSATPSFIIGGKVITGDVDLSVIEAAVDEELKRR